MCKKHCLWVGFTCKILEISFQRAAAICVMLVALASHRILTGLPIQSDSDQSLREMEKGETA